MSEIKVDLEFLNSEKNTCATALENLKEHIENIKNKYKEILDNQKSDEFIKEFEESMDEIVEQLEKMSEESFEEILNSIEKLGITFTETDENLAKPMGG